MIAVFHLATTPNHLQRMKRKKWIENVGRVPRKATFTISLYNMAYARNCVESLMVVQYCRTYTDRKDGKTLNTIRTVRTDCEMALLTVRFVKIIYGS